MYRQGEITAYIAELYCFNMQDAMPEWAAVNGHMCQLYFNNADLASVTTSALTKPRSVQGGPARVFRAAASWQCHKLFR